MKTAGTGTARRDDKMSRRDGGTSVQAQTEKKKSNAKRRIRDRAAARRALPQ